MKTPAWVKIALVAFALFWVAGAIHGCVLYHERHAHHYYPWWDVFHQHERHDHDHWRVLPPK
jgi:hypothetical protein